MIGSVENYRRHRELIGISPPELEMLVAIMSHERVYGVGVTRQQIAAMLDIESRSAASLLRLGWIQGDRGPVPNEILTVTDRGWAAIWPWRNEWPEPLPEPRMQRRVG